MEEAASGAQSSAFIELDRASAPPPLDIARFPSKEYGVFFSSGHPLMPVCHQHWIAVLNIIAPLFFPAQFFTCIYPALELFENFLCITACADLSLDLHRKKRVGSIACRKD